MSKSREISKEEKLAIVKRCLSGELGVCEAGRQMGVNQESIVIEGFNTLTEYSITS